MTDLTYSSIIMDVSVSAACLDNSFSVAVKHNERRQDGSSACCRHRAAGTSVGSSGNQKAALATSGFALMPGTCRLLDPTHPLLQHVYQV